MIFHNLISATSKKGLAVGTAQPCIRQSPSLGPQITIPKNQHFSSFSSHSYSAQCSWNDKSPNFWSSVSSIVVGSLHPHELVRQNVALPLACVGLVTRHCCPTPPFTAQNRCPFLFLFAVGIPFSLDEKLLSILLKHSGL
ncbi:hypothetical protein AAHA92_21925 [Salvia divinorum]|uniref:Uncharacterized protein n=1 Tax=Salvia divinorum TaxID=28513 RepID=A0ABD1GM14_SALDI